MAAVVAVLSMSLAIAPSASAAAPTITKLEPNHGPATGGTSVMITGTNFTGVTAVKFGPTAATSFTVNSESSITAVSPAGTGIVRVAVTAQGGTGESVEFFDYGPRLSGLAPIHGPTTGGTSVTITGTNFIEVKEVKFGSTNATSFTVNSENSITAVSPAHEAGEVEPHVTTSGGTNEFTGITFRYLQNINAHYYSNGAKLKESNGVFGEAGVKEVIGWGTIDVKCVKAVCGVGTMCHSVIAGEVWNPIGGGAGKGETQAWPSWIAKPFIAQQEL